MNEHLDSLWATVCDYVRQRISQDAFQRWFSPTRLVTASEEAMTISVPNQIHQFWIESNYGVTLQDALVTLLGAPRDLRFMIEAPVGTGGRRAMVLPLARRRPTAHRLVRRPGDSTPGPMRSCLRHRHG